MRPHFMPTSSRSSMRAEALNSTVAFFTYRSPPELVHRLFVGQGQRAPVVGDRGVEIHQVVGVEHDLLHVHFGPAHAQAVEETEVVARCHRSGLQGVVPGPGPHRRGLAAPRGSRGPS